MELAQIIRNILISTFFLVNITKSFAQLCPYPPIVAELTTLIWAEEISWSILNEDGTTAAGPFSNFLNGSTYIEQLCLPPGCYTALLEDSFGDGWHNGSITFTSVTGEVLALGTVNQFSNSLDLFTSPDCGMIICPAGESTFYYTITGDLYGAEVSWGVEDEAGTTAAGPFYGYADNTQYSGGFCLAPDCYTIWMHDSFGDGWQGAELTIQDDNGTVVAFGSVLNPPGSDALMPLSLLPLCPIIGCTNPEAMNFNPEANQDDGSCVRQSDNVSLFGTWNSSALPTNGFGGRYSDVEGLEVNGREYAIIGSTLGTHVIDVTDPGATIEVSFLPGADGGSFVTHRDYHINGNILYAVCDQGASTLQIFDLSSLPYTVSTLYDSNEFCVSAHNVFVDNASNLLYLLSTSSIGGYSAVKVLDVSNPYIPTEFIDLSPWISYCHDIYVENDTAWINSGGAGLFVMHINATPTMLGTLTDYPFQGGNHSGWWVPGDNIYVMADETHGSPLKVVDTSNMNDLIVLSTLSSGVDPQSIPHNLMIRNGLVFVSYYHDGLQVFNIRDPVNPKRIAWFDTFNETTHAGFRGAWGVHSALPSGKILISDMINGLFVLELETEVIEVCPTSPTIWNGIPISADGLYSTEVTIPVWGTDIALVSATINQATCPPCLGDFNQNGVIGVIDLQMVLSEIYCTSNCLVDLNNDNSTTVEDLLILLGLFGTTCP